MCENFDAKCEQIQKNGRKCQNLKCGKNEIWCWKHVKDQLEPMDISEDETEFLSEVEKILT